ncbi:MAG: CocE/NonD family hydrolase, partial [Candidatus Heimdallarchaeaceae archaeon]
MKRKALAVTLSIVFTIALATTISVIVIKNIHKNGSFDWNIPSNSTIKGSYAKIPYKIRMSDGVRLGTDVYVPKDINSSLPVIFIRTPYNKNDLEAFAAYTDLDYIIVTQDMRGYYNSEGEKGMPFFFDGNDGKESIYWIEEQPWCNGKIGTWGLSALGITQYLLAPNASDSLKCQMPIVATPDVYEAAFRGGSLRSELMLPWMEAQGYSEEIIQQFKDFEKLDQKWDSARIVNDYAFIHVPALHFGGWYDIFTQDTINAFMGYQYHGGEGAKGNSKLVMGPWVHGGAFGAPSGVYKDIDYVYPNQDMGIIFLLTDTIFEKWLKNNGTAWDNLPNVVFYLMSSLPYNQDKLANNWYSSDIWPLQTEEQEWFLYSNRSLLSSQPEGENNVISYLYDPNNPVPTIGGGNLALAAGAYDQQELEEREDVLVFTSPILDEPITVIGRINVTLEISSNCTDTDFTVKLTDVFPDNTSMLITDTIIRARNRNSYSSWDFMQPGEKYLLNISLDSTAYLFNKGHRIRIDISSSNYPRFEVNPNTGDALWENTTTYVANNSIYLDTSKIILPTYDYNELTPFSFDSLKIKALKIPKQQNMSEEGSILTG